MLARPTARRRGMTVVEVALVLNVFLMLLFGVFEYCRFLFVLHVTQNAARDAARYATVNLNKPATFDATDFTSGTGTTYRSVQNYTTDRMANVQRQLTGYQVAVYAVDPAGLTQTPLVVRPKSASPPAYPDPFSLTDPNRVAWNQVSFPDRVAVTIRGTYKPALAGLLIMPSSIPVTVTRMSGSEG